MGSKGNKTLKKDELNKKTLRKVNSTNLKKLGEVSLKEKIQNAVEEHSDEETQAIVLHQSMTPGEKSNAWTQHQTHLKKCGNESLKKDFESLDRKGKGLSTALFLLKKNRAVYAHVSKEAAKETSLKKREKWLSEMEANAKWSPAELEKHIQSGRVIWRECPTTWGVYEYQDTADYEKEVVGRKRCSWQFGQEYELGEEDEEDWQEALDKDLHSLMLGCLEKGKGSGKSLEKGKGKSGKGKRHGKDHQPMEDEPEEKPLTLAEALKKAKKTRDLLSSTHSNFEEALKKVEKSPYLSKQAFKDKQEVLTNLTEVLKKTKQLLEKGDKNKLEKVKSHLVEACASMKHAKEEAKELVQIGMKALSKAASSKPK